LRLRSLLRPSRPSSAHEPRVPRRPLAVAGVGVDPLLEGRLERLSRTAGTLQVVAVVHPDLGGDVPPLPAETDVTVVSLGLAPTGLAALRELRRANHAWRTVVVAQDTTWFDEAFSLGADAWIDATADDRTLELAITGHRPVVDLRHR
jgi:DNA-binding NarL/FixJ family response regulator